MTSSTTSPPNDRPRRICVVVTARPSYSRIKTALRAIEQHPDLELLLVIAGSALLDRYGTAADVMAADGFEPTARVFMVLEGETPHAMAKTTGLGVMELATTFDNLQPDAVVTIADRYETMATAIAASYMNLPLVHVQGGEVTGSIDEKVRHAITKLADLHLVSTETAAQRVIRMGEEPDRVHVTGCPSIDLAAEVQRSPALDFDPFATYGGVGDQFDLDEGYLVVMQHPVTTEFEHSREQTRATLDAVRASGRPAFWFWPNVDAGSGGVANAIRSFREQHLDNRLHWFKNMKPNDFLRLLCNSSCLVGNSSVGIRECSFLGVPTVNIGSRQQGRERGRNVVDVDFDPVAIERAIRRQCESARPESDPIYGDGAAGSRIAERLATSTLSIEKRLTF